MQSCNQRRGGCDQAALTARESLGQGRFGVGDVDSDDVGDQRAVECLCNQIGHHAGIFATFGGRAGKDDGGGQLAQAGDQGRDGVGAGCGFQHFQAVEAHAEIVAERRLGRVSGV